MAGRYLLIEFDDSASAEALRAQIDAASRKGKRYRVAGLFAIPGPTFCECDTHTNTKTQKSTLKRGSKFGWWVCTECKKPSSVMRLKNLVGVEDIIRPRLSRLKDSITRRPVDMVHYALSIELPTRLYTVTEE